MIVKQREKPDYVEKVEVLLGRVPEQHPALLEIRSELSHAGLQGELNVGFYVKESLQLDTKVVHDLRLRADTRSFFEMDTFVATKQFALIFETKNYAGLIKYGSQSRQIVRNDKVLPNRFTQVWRQQDKFR